jgi:hypothetical protein
MTSVVRRLTKGILWLQKVSNFDSSVRNTFNQSCIVSFLWCLAHLNCFSILIFRKRGLRLEAQLHKPNENNLRLIVVKLGGLRLLNVASSERMAGAVSFYFLWDRSLIALSVLGVVTLDLL